MSTLLKLRDYQEACIDALMRDVEGGTPRVAAVLPTGAGKTVVFSHLVSLFVEMHPGKRVLILAHTDELVEQAVKKLKAVAPSIKVGVVKAARNEVWASVIVASVQSLRNPKRRDTIRNVGLVVVDECHHATAKTYRDILKHYGCMSDQGAPVRLPDETDAEYQDAVDLAKDAESWTPVVGFTATLVRGDNASLSDVWQKVSFRRDISFMIRRGYLLNPIGKRVEIDDFDLRKVKKSGGDYQASALEEALTASMAPEIVAKAYVEHAGERPGILFAPTVDSAYEFATALSEQGIISEVVHGALARDERRAILGRLESGETQVVANCMVLTEGFDSPKVSCIVIARPTRSAGLYQQMVGRGLRPDLTAPRDGQDCLILDVVGASQVHGLASLVDLSTKEIRLVDGQGLIEMEDDFDTEGDGSGERVGPSTFYGPTVVVDFDPLADASKRLWMKTAGGTWFLSTGFGSDTAYVFIVPATPQACDCADNCDPAHIICHNSRGDEVSCGEECQHVAFPACMDGYHGEAPCAACEGRGRVAGAAGTYDVMWCRKVNAKGAANGGVTEHVGVTLDLAFAWGEDVAADMGGEFGGSALNKAASWRKSSAAPTEPQQYKCRQLGITIPDGATKNDVSILIDTHAATRRIDPIAAWFANQTVGVTQ